jgi:hypothetical protein
MPVQVGAGVPELNGAQQSLLRIGKGQREQFPGTEEVQAVVVRTARLDERLTEAMLPRPCLLKIDVQGGELLVLQGASGIMHLLDEVLVECSFVELYDGQPLAGDVVAFLRERGFGLAGVSTPAQGHDGEPVQADFQFRRPDERSAAAGDSGHALVEGR